MHPYFLQPHHIKKYFNLLELEELEEIVDKLKVDGFYLFYSDNNAFKYLEQFLEDPLKK